MTKTEYEVERSEKTENFIQSINEIYKNHEAPFLFEDDVIAMTKEYVREMDKIQLAFIKSSYDN